MPMIHPQARTTPMVRAEIARSTEPASVLAQRYGVSGETIRKWRMRGAQACDDRSSRPKRLAWRVTEGERAIICAVRSTTGLPLDDLTFVLRHFLPHLNRDRIYRALRAEGLSRRPPRPSWPPLNDRGEFGAHGPGVVHLGLKRLPQLRTVDGEIRKRCFYVAIDHCSRFLHSALYDDDDAANATAFVAEAGRSFPTPITHILADDGSCLAADDFERACANLNVSRLVTELPPTQLDGLGEQLNRRGAGDVLAIGVARHADLDTLLVGFNHVYNCRRQRVLAGSASDQAARYLGRTSRLANSMKSVADNDESMADVHDVLDSVDESSSRDNGSDLLDDMLSSLRLSGGVFLDGEFRNPWSVLSRVGPDDCAKFFPRPKRVIAYHFVRTGTLFCKVGDGLPEPVKAGEIIILARNDPHCLYGTTQADTVDIRTLIGPKVDGLFHVRAGGSGDLTSIYCGYLGSSVAENALLDCLPRIMKISTDALDRDCILRSLDFAVQNLSVSSPEILGKLAEAFFAEAVRRYAQAMPNQQGWLSAVRDPAVGKVLALVHGRYAEAWTLAKLARGAGVSKTVLAARFRALMDQSVMRYVGRWRLEIAKGMLRDSRKNVSSIAYSVGFYSEAAFSRAFKRELGLSPATWRRVASGRD